MGAPEQTAEPRAYRSFWSQVGRDFPSLKGAASTDYYFDGERLLFEQFFPRLAGRTVFLDLDHDSALDPGAIAARGREQHAAGSAGGGDTHGPKGTRRPV